VFATETLALVLLYSRLLAKAVAAPFAFVALQLLKKQDCYFSFFPCRSANTSLQRNKIRLSN